MKRGKGTIMRTLERLAVAAQLPIGMAMGRVAVAIALSMGLFGVTCARGVAPSRPAAHEATAATVASPAPPAPPHDSSLSPLLKPVSGLRCPPDFPHAYQFVGTTESEERQLFRIIWLDGVSRGNNVVATQADAPNASEARCLAVGPHRDLNIANWCCR
jgi:hypothetical protein